MTLTAARQKLHDFAEHADEVKIFEMLSLFEQNDNKGSNQYDEETINMLKQRSAEYLSGKSKTHTVEESMRRIKKHIYK